MPSPVVAQLGSTFHVWSLATTARLRASETSFGRIAGKLFVSLFGPNYHRLSGLDWMCRRTSANVLLVSKD